MKNSWTLHANASEKERRLLATGGIDERSEIDNPDPYHRVRIHYLDRLRKVISLVRESLPHPEGTKVGDFGCAQGNTGLLLAEMGYEVYAVDQNPLHIEYSKLKYERGKIQWFVSRIDALDFPADFLDAAILGEVIEHAAWPETVVATVLRFVRPGGILILTTPNGSRVGIPRPTLAQVCSVSDRQSLAQRQYGDEHLFKLLPSEVHYLVPKGARILEAGYCGSTVLINRYSEHLLRLFPVRLVERIVRMLSKVPVFNAKTYNSQYVVLRKDAAEDGKNASS